MKIHWVIVSTIFLLAASCKSSKTVVEDKMMEIVVKFMTTKSYCGGAPPSQEILDREKTPRPLANTTFYIKKGHKNISSTPVYLEVKTDRNGEINVKVPTGDYLILNSSQTSIDILKGKMTNIKITDQEGLNQWWENGIFKFSDKITMLDTVLQKECDLPLAVPFLKYNGPPRPGRK